LDHGARRPRDYYSATDARLGFDYGIAKNLQGALYWNLSSVAEDRVIPGASQRTRLNDTELDSFRWTSSTSYRTRSRTLWGAPSTWKGRSDRSWPAWTVG